MFVLYVVTYYCLAFFGTEVEGRLSCTFDDGNFCGWDQSTKDHFDWRIASGSTDDTTSGPPSDHTTGNGSYALATGRDISATGNVAFLTSGFFYTYQPFHLSFWYHMNGIGMDHLAVVVTDLDGRESTAWLARDRTGPEWKKALIVVQNNVKKLKIVAQLRLHYSADVAIDDIEVDHEPNILTTTAASTTLASLPFDCTFDEGHTCSWQRETTTPKHWHLGHGPSPDFSSGPQADHTKGDGNYVYVTCHDLTGRNDTFESSLFTPLLEFYLPTHLTFWYHMSGRHIDSLSVSQRMADGRELALWRKSSDQGHDWNKADVSILMGSSQIFIRASCKSIFSGDIAVDDVVFNPSPSLANIP